ncbi:MAG: RnfABCDGE type electron transport complex subunit D, partial [Actinomycetota bacterium]|nr:RnfABCDGE type electron transport complex subunit D [Actinomycetota bacterium]
GRPDPIPVGGHLVPAGAECLCRSDPDTAVTMSTSDTAALPNVPRLVLRGRDIPVILPSRRDPRLRLAAVLLTVQVLGQTVLDFKLSIAQILVAIGVSALVEMTVTFRREQKLVWPASAMLTGNSVALLLRATGTEHGDWWSLNGIHFFALAALLALLSKYLVRPSGRHLFNPSNVGLVWVLLVVGPAGVFPQYLWWGPYLSLPVVLTFAVILLGAVWILRALGMMPMVVSFLVTFGLLIAFFAAAGNSFWAIWHPVPVAGTFYWVNLVLSPEVLIFVFFMMSDPQTAPKAPLARMIFGAAPALVAAGLVWFQPTEFGVKLGILSSLTVTCALVPVIEQVSRRIRRRQLNLPIEPSDPRPMLAQLRAAASSPSMVAAAIIAVAAPIDTAALADNEELILIEQGLSADPDPQ